MFPQPDQDPHFLRDLHSTGTATDNPNHRYFSLFVGRDVKVLSTNDLMCSSCFLSYCVIGLAWAVLTFKKQTKNK